MNNLANAMLAKKMFHQIECRGEISHEMRNGIKRRIKGLMSFKIYSVIFSSVDTIVISSFLGLTQLAVYNNYYYIQTSIIAFMTILTTSITAGVGNKMVTSSVEENYKDFKKCTFLNGWLSSWCAVCLFCLYQPFMKVWVGEKLMFDFPIMILMVLYFFLPRVTTITFTYREAAGLWYEDRFRPLIASCVNLIFNIWWVRYIGMYGIILSTLFCTVFINIPWGTNILFKNYFKIKPYEYYGMILKFIVVTAAAGMVTFGISYLAGFDGILNVAVTAILCVIIPNIIFYAAYRKTEEFEFAKSIILKVINSLREKIR